MLLTFAVSAADILFMTIALYVCVLATSEAHWGLVRVVLQTISQTL